MPAIAGAGGHVAGSLNIVGTLNTQNIEKGFSRVKSSFNSAKGYVAGFGADMVRVSQNVSEFTSKFSKLAVIGVGALAALAKSSPAVAPAIASMTVSLTKLSIALGEALAPAFTKVAEWLSRFSGWVSDNKSEIKIVTTAFVDLGEKIGSILVPPLNAVADFAMNHPNLFAGIVAGLTLGPTVISGITTLGGFLVTLGSTVVSASMLTALGYVSAIAASGFGGWKLGESIGESTYSSIGESFVTSSIGSTIASAFAGLSDLITGGNTQAEYQSALSSYRQSRNEEDKRNFLFEWWDSVFG